MNQFDCLRVDEFQAVERRIESDKIFMNLRGGGGLMQFLPLKSSPPLQSPFSSGVLDQDPAHGLGRGGEEVSTPVKLLRMLARRPVGSGNEPEKGLMNECRRLQRLPGVFLRQLTGGELPQLVVNQWKKL